MFTRRILALAAAILTAAAIATAADGAAPSHHDSVPAGSTTGTVHILANGPQWR